jgi:hypothetical protein
MSNSRSLRAIGLLLGGALAGASLFAVPKYASSAFREADAVEGAIVYEQGNARSVESITHQPNNPDGWGGMQQVPAGIGRGPMRVSSRLFPANDDCAAVKLDVWINRGLLTYSLFNNPDAGAPPADSTDVPGRTTMLIGGKNCRVRVLIERMDDN